VASGALDLICQFVEVGQSFLDVLPHSQALRWPVNEMVLGAITALPSFIWLLSVATWGMRWIG
jgi:hypothetical protein